METARGIAAKILGRRRVPPAKIAAQSPVCPPFRRADAPLYSTIKSGKSAGTQQGSYFRIATAESTIG